MNWSVEVVKRTLANGLDVIVHPSRRLPIVAVDILYRVGSKNDPKGRAGLAHMTEHLMFGAGDTLGPDGGVLDQMEGLQNASTTTDRTSFWATAPAGALEAVLWMESERMIRLSNSFTAEHLDNERSIILRERRQNYENSVDGRMALMAVSAALFPEDHPYRHLPIGVPEDIHRITLDDVHSFRGRFYHAGNASIVLAGDVDVDHGLSLVERYFGDCAPCATPAAVTARPLPRRERRLVLEDAVRLPRLYLAWPSAARFSLHHAELTVLADLLGGDLRSRLHRTLVMEKRLAVHVSAVQHSRQLGGLLMIGATAAPGVRLDDIAALVIDEVERLVSEGPTPVELKSAIAQAEARFAHSWQTLGGAQGRAAQLNGYNAFCGDPGFAATDLQRYRDITPATIRAAGHAVLGSETRALLSIVSKALTTAALRDSMPMTLA